MARSVYYLIKPTSVDYTGTSATISANGSVSFTALSSLSLNNVFTSTYDNYKIVMWVAGFGGAETVLCRFRKDSEDESGATSYVSQLIRTDSTTIVDQRVTANQLYTSLIAHPSGISGGVVDVYGPYLQHPTAFRGVSIRWDSPQTYDTAGTHNQSVAYDGFTFFANNPAEYFSAGRVAVYGMRK